MIDSHLVFAMFYAGLGTLALLGAGFALVRSVLRADKNELIVALVLTLVAALCGLSSLEMTNKAEAASRQEK